MSEPTIESVTEGLEDFSFGKKKRKAKAKKDGDEGTTESDKTETQKKE
jgi:hypothetical protein